MRYSYMIVLLLMGCALNFKDKNHDSVEITEDKVTVSQSKMNCLQINKKEIYSILLSAFYKNDFHYYLHNKIQNEAYLSGADHVFIEYNKGALFERSKAHAVFYGCRPIENIPLNALESSCNIEQVQGCLAAALRMQSEKNYSSMMSYFVKACDLQDEYSCEWLTEYETQKILMKKSCIQKDSTSCFASAMLADINNDLSLMMAFLKQGCSYGHTESCFYQNYIEEERRRRQDGISSNDLLYITNLQGDILNQKRIESILHFLNRSPAK